jgi:hypothetical protein
MEVTEELTAQAGDPQRCPVTLIWVQLRTLGCDGKGLGMNYS